jgi:hypothetical protein
MNPTLCLTPLLAASGRTSAQQSVLCALLPLGMLASLAHGVLSATDALRVFFHTENCLFVRKQWRGKTAAAIMSHGVQLPDLFEVLPLTAAHRECQRELAVMRALCLKLLEEQP